jgi:molybdopterin converting factor small subunit
MVAIKIPTPLRPYAGGQSEVAVQGKSVAEAMENLMSQYPSLRPNLTNGDGKLRPFVNLYLGQNNIRDLQGLETPLKESDKLVLIPSIAGG